MYPLPAHGPLHASFLSAFASLARAFCEDLAALGVPLQSFQDLEAELAGLPGKYANAAGGGLWLALAPMVSNGKEDVRFAGWPAPYVVHMACLGPHAVLGGVALRALPALPGSAEVKRLYVLPRARGMGAGAALLRGAEDAAAGAGYGALRLDSLARLGAARKLYARAGFVETGEAYCNHPMEDARCLLKPPVGAGVKR